MKNDSPNNSNCRFAAETLDFLYGELNKDRNDAFLTHLDGCSSCADEIRGFSNLRFSIQNWKAAEFDKLATPEILISYQSPAITPVETEKISWVDSIKVYLTFSPVFSGATAVLILAILVGFGIFVFRNNENDLLADSNQKPVISDKRAVSPQNAPLPDKDQGIVKNEHTESEKPLKEYVMKDEKEPVEKPVPVRSNGKSGAKEYQQPIKALEKKSPSIAPALNSIKKKKTVPNTNNPRLNELPEDVEDNSLRLADLFAELDTRK